MDSQMEREPEEEIDNVVFSFSFFCKTNTQKVQTFI